MKHCSVLVMTMVAVGAVFACSDDDDGPAMQTAGGTGGGGSGGTAGSAGTAGAGGSSGAAGSGGSMSGAGGTGVPTVPPTPALPADAPTVACPTVINGALEASDPSQTGRHSRIAPIAACGMAKGSPGTDADPVNPHLYDVYRFVNPTTAAVCFNFELTYGEISVVDGGLDGGADATAPEPDTDPDAGDGGVIVPPVNAGPARYMTAHGTFFPTGIALEYRGDVGDRLTSPQVMGITVPAGETIDVVVYAIDVAPAGVGSYTLSCSTQ